MKREVKLKRLSDSQCTAIHNVHNGELSLCKQTDKVNQERKWSRVNTAVLQKAEIVGMLHFQKWNTLQLPSMTPNLCKTVLILNTTAAFLHQFSQIFLSVSPFSFLTILHFSLSGRSLTDCIVWVATLNIAVSRLHMNRHNKTRHTSYDLCKGAQKNGYKALKMAASKGEAS